MKHRLFQGAALLAFASASALMTDAAMASARTESLHRTKAAEMPIDLGLSQAHNGSYMTGSGSSGDQAVKKMASATTIGDPGGDGSLGYLQGNLLGADRIDRHGTPADLASTHF